MINFRDKNTFTLSLYFSGSNNWQNGPAGGPGMGAGMGPNMQAGSMCQGGMNMGMGGYGPGPGMGMGMGDPNMYGGGMGGMGMGTNQRMPNNMGAMPNNAAGNWNCAPGTAATGWGNQGDGFGATYQQGYSAGPMRGGPVSTPAARNTPYNASKYHVTSMSPFIKCFVDIKTFFRIIRCTRCNW